jgi:hypothetical protein
MNLAFQNSLHFKPARNAASPQASTSKRKMGKVTARQARQTDKAVLDGQDLSDIQAFSAVLGLRAKLIKPAGAVDRR